MRAARLALALAALSATSLAGCGLEDGERFGRAGAHAGQLRIHTPVELGELDPPRTERALERAVALQLFATLLDGDGRARLATERALERAVALQLFATLLVGAGRARLATAVVPSADGRTATITLDANARFSDGTPLSADAVVWSWRRALLRSTGTRDPSPFSAIENGRALAEGRLLHLARATVGRSAPFTRLGEAPEANTALELAPGTAVNVLDTNERKPCCGGSVTLRREPEAGDALGMLHASDIGTVIGERSVKGRSFLLIRSPNGASGWAEQGLLATHVSPASLVRVIDRGDDSAALRVGPDEDAPIRERLADDAVVEILGEAEGWLHAVDLGSGQMGFLPRRAIEALRGERQWVQIEVVGDAAVDAQRAWVPLRELVFDPSALGARALDAVTIEVGCAGGQAELLAALAHPALAPVPPHVIAAHGRAWTDAAHMVTSGPFSLGPRARGRLVLLRSETSFERRRAHLERVELVHIRDAISALHLYRAGELDVLLTLPDELAPVLSRAADFAPARNGGGLVAPEVRGFSIDRLELRDVEVAAP